MNLSEISIQDLKALLEKIPAEIKRREKDEKQRVRQELEAIAAKAGFTLGDLLGDAGTKDKKTSSVAVKYRHPDNVTLAWTGRGRQPRWVADFVAAGGTLEQLQVTGSL